ncbi:MAG: bifunctional diaminohydroxyphosphoribosylaminopyrimidine deaminase/5-amino-6-(5-phosphoribosylamino)uracil reductase RibD [Synechococcales cyanobacterium RM1_1_8]|nr:bifunctional diaminohydroxyphosphoribosylaminopyrimidine deaminase/5-amino-6-(5-phosphoribosylamino)uracil reductase RibD [Synechococcales cyanobacterium RM1_1_8]
MPDPNLPDPDLPDPDLPDSDLLDRHYIQRCLTLARQAQGRTAPNPMVGCVLVNGDRQIIGEGFHPQAGQPHAEVFALGDAIAQGHSVVGATAYVNLEPCSHQGRTPPCAQALIQAQVGRVVVGMVDPNPQVAGRGIQALRNAGIAVSVGVEEAACQQLNEAFVHRMVHQQPFGIFKYAMTLDGKIATASGHSQWVTQAAARQRVHQLRAACDAVIVGGNTVRQDNPNLGTHGQASHNPLRVVMSRSLDLPRKAQLWDLAQGATVVFTAADPVTDAEVVGEPRLHGERLAWLGDRGVEVVQLPQLEPQAVMAELYGRGLSSVLWECGGRLGARAITQGCIQKILAFIAPKIVGGQGYSPIADLGIERMDLALTLERIRWETVGSDLLLEGYLPCRSNTEPLEY